jgi:hypothetical protein
MAEVVGTTKNFDLPVDEIIEQALEGLGGEHTSQNEAKLARRSLNLLFIDMQNRGMVPLASMEQVELALVSGSGVGYSMSPDVLNVLDAVIRVSSSSGTSDIPIEPLSYIDYLEIPQKLTQGRPTGFLVDRQRDNLKITLWPVPDTQTYSFVSWSCVKTADVNKSYQLVDFSTRYLPAIVNGLRWQMSQIRGLPLDVRQVYKNEYLEALQLALEEDRERVDFDVYPSSKIQLGS